MSVDEILNSIKACFNQPFSPGVSHVSINSSRLSFSIILIIFHSLLPPALPPIFYDYMALNWKKWNIFR